MYASQLLYGATGTGHFDHRVQRIIARDHLTEDAARARIAAQPSDGFYREKCGYIIENNGDLDTLYRDTDALYQILMK